MAERDNHGRRYTVHASGAIADSIRRIQRRAKREGRGDKVVATLSQIYERLQQDPSTLGEPLYRLSALRLEVRTCVVRPIVVNFAVHETKPLVFIKGIRLLTELA